MPAAVAIPLAIGAATTAAGVYGAKKQSESADKAAAVTERSNAEATALARETEANRRREFDQQQAELKRQWDVTESNKAPYRQVSSDALLRVRDLLGLPQGAPMSAGSAGAGSSSAGAPVGNIPPTPKSVDDAIAAANQIAYGGQQKHQDKAYWDAMFAKDPDYTWKRMLGWQAGASDAATTGPYAGAARPSTAMAAAMPPKVAASASPGILASNQPYQPIIPFRDLLRGVQ
jgi:hypothetical protein